MSKANTTARKALFLGRTAMWSSIVVMAVSFAIAYPLADRFGLATQILAHLAIPFAAAFLKLGYVVRLASHHALGNFNAG